ncbi:MAG: DNA polymerase IV [Clostridia bacterium]|nr:DNA polymerase IV [Clostridia bacterium]
MRTISHVDMDCFFAAVEALDHPEYRGKPLVVGGPRGSTRAVVSTCSYEARRFGVRSAMPVSQAERLCPQAIFVTGNMRRYAEVSREIMEVLRGFTPLVQQVSIDEAFLDMTGCEQFHADSHAMGAHIKRAIRDASGLNASVGIAPNRFLAKLGSDMSKPDGLLVIRLEDVDSFLSPLPVGRLWGVGEKGREALGRYGIATVADLRSWPREWLVERYGRWGAEAYDLARGVDDSPVVPDEERKSYGSECTFDTDVCDASVLRTSIAQHSRRVGRRLRSDGRLARTVTIKVKFADFTQITRGHSLSEPFDSDDSIYHAACALLDGLNLAAPVRLIGVSVSGIHDSRQLCLFQQRPPEHSVGAHGASEAGQGSGKSIDHVLDGIAEEFGVKGVMRGRELEMEARQR